MYKIYCINCGGDKLIAENSSDQIGFRCRSCHYWDYSINYEKQKGENMNCTGCGSDKLFSDLGGFRCAACNHWDCASVYEKQKGGSMNKVEVTGFRKTIGIHDIPFGKYAVVVGICEWIDTCIGDVIYKGGSSTNDGGIVNLCNKDCNYSHRNGHGIQIEVLPEGTEIKIVVSG